MSRLVYSTFVPSIESTEILLSPSRVTSAMVPWGVKVAWLVPDFPSAIVTLPPGVTVLPEIVNTDTVPSLRLATSASVPWRLIEMPAPLWPASSVAMTAGGDAFRSMTDTRVSGTVLVGSLGSTLLDEPTSARLSSGVRATLRGGPTTLPGAAISATTRGGDALRSMIVTVSGAGFCTIFTAPLSSMTLLSLDVTASCACAADVSRNRTIAAKIDTRRWAFIGHLRGFERAIAEQFPASNASAG